MGITIEKVAQTGQHEVTVTVAAADREALRSTQARELALRVGTQHLGRCGFDKYGDYGYRNPPDAAHPAGRLLGDAELSGLERGLRPGGTHLMEIVVKGSV